MQEDPSDHKHSTEDSNSKPEDPLTLVQPEDSKATVPPAVGRLRGSRDLAANPPASEKPEEGEATVPPAVGQLRGKRCPSATPSTSVTSLKGKGAMPPEFMPRIDTQDIFRELIAAEVRNGRLTPARRRRIVRYGASLRLSAVEIGNLIASCREEALNSPDPTERPFRLRLADYDESRFPVAVRLAAVVAVAIVLDLLLIYWVL